MVSIAKDVENLEGTCLTFRSGNDALSAFRTNSTFATRYQALSSGPSASSALSRTFLGDDQFAFYSFNMTTYKASLRGYVDFLNEHGLKRWLAELASPFPENPGEDVLRNYKAFFNAFGSHAITSTTYGARFQLVSVFLLRQKNSLHLVPRPYGQRTQTAK